MSDVSDEPSSEPDDEPGRVDGTASPPAIELEAKAHTPGTNVSAPAQPAGSVLTAAGAGTDYREPLGDTLRLETAGTDAQQMREAGESGGRTVPLSGAIHAQSSLTGELTVERQEVLVRVTIESSIAFEHAEGSLWRLIDHLSAENGELRAELEAVKDEFRQLELLHESLLIEKGKSRGPVLGLTSGLAKAGKFVSGAVVAFAIGASGGAGEEGMKHLLNLGRDAERACEVLHERVENQITIVGSPDAHIEVTIDTE